MSLNPRLPLAPHVAMLIESVRRAGYPPLYQLPVLQARKVYETSVGVTALPAVAVPRVEDLSIPGGAGQPMPARLWSPTTDAAAPVLLYLHGGGFVIGSINTCESMCRQIALQSGAAVVAIDYRLAPEHRFPAALDDSWAALRWLRDQAVVLGFDPDRMAVGGDSAGATLAASTALLARDAGLKLSKQLMFYPSVQVSQSTDSFRRYAESTLLSRPLMAWFDENAKDPAVALDWRREPLRASDHRGLAPAWIGLAECDALTDDGHMYARALQAAGVPVDVQVWPGMIHDFINMGRLVPEAAQAHAAFAAALRDAFGA